DGPRPVKQNGSGLGEVSSPCAQALTMKESSASSPAGPSVDSVFNDSSIQRIIDKYTRELNVSLSAAGTAAGAYPVYSLVQPSHRHHFRAAGISGLEAVRFSISRSRTSQNLRNALCFSRRFRPQLTDQSSCLAPEESQSVLEQLVGQPSANSSTIGPRPGPSASLSRWDSTLTRMIGSLSQRSGSRRLSPGQDFDAGRITSEPSWLEEFPEEIRMRPLVGELDDSAEQHSGSSESSEPSRLASAHSPSVPHVSPHSQVPQNQSGLVELDSYRAEDSFHPLLPEITHNETADPSMTFHLPEHNTSDSSDRNQADAQHGVSTPSVEDDPSPEQLRTEEPNCCRALEESFSQLVISECLLQESVLILSPTMRTDSCVPSNSGTPVLSTSQAGTSKELKHLVPEAARERGILDQSQITLVSLTDTTLQDEDMITTDDEEVQDNRGPDSIKEDGQEGVQTKLKELTRLKLTEFSRSPGRLYEQLEEVKQQRAVRSRQEDGAKNRLKAKEFHRVKPTGLPGGGEALQLN
ncbi:hypothetical protein XENOCAPTIV_015192, partial [Xenoophorus captivus]